MRSQPSRSFRRTSLFGAWASLTVAAAPALADPALPSPPAPLLVAIPGAAPPITADLSPLPLYGFKDDLVYLRDPRDVVRLHPHAELDLDAHGFYGSKVDSLGASEAGVDLAPRFFVRRARFGLAGELFERIAFDASLDLVANPAIDGARADGTSTRVALADAWAKVDGGRALSLMLGVFQAPFSFENRTATSDLAMMERNVAIRGFAIPGGKALGAAIGGAAQDGTLHWNLGAFGAESVTPGQFEKHFDGIGRVYIRPLAAHTTSTFRGLQIGVSARSGTRYPRDTTDDAPAITSGQGFALWRPTHADALGRVLHVIPSATQAAAGIEFRLPIKAFALRSEAYWVSRGTREAIDGYQSTNTERLGVLQGVGWYAEVSVWALQAGGLIDGGAPDLAEYPTAEHLELARVTPPPQRHGLEIALLGAGVNAHYDAASRGGAADASSPATGLQIYQMGLAINYWHSSHFRLSMNGNAYIVPGAGGRDNLAMVPGNLGNRDPGAHALWELGGRTTLMF
jgi:hypothetical protein